MVKAKKWVVETNFKGVPKKNDFKIVEYELRPLKDNEVLVKVLYVSVDPYQRAYNKFSNPPYDQYGLQIAEVIESKASSFPVGSKVVTHRGWCTHSIINIATVSTSDYCYKVPDLLGQPLPLAIGAAGMVGMTAYFGLLEICKPKAGETLVVTGAAGAVGSLVGQIAKIKGCKVIGFAGSDEKVSWLKKECHFDEVFNYKTVDAAKELRKAAPKGVDCYFDNVGGELSSIIINQMNLFGRISVCGSISAYNDESLPKATILQPAMVFKQLKMEGFIVHRWDDRREEAFAQLIKWTKEKKIVSRFHITEGFDNIYDAFIGMLAGDNIGKAIVKL